MKWILLFVGVFLFFASNGLAADSIDYKTYEPHGINITQDYLQTFEEIDTFFGNADEDFLRRYHVIFVPGIFSQFVRFLGQGILKWTKEARYFDDHAEFLREKGVETTILEVESEQTSEFNSRIVQRAILSSEKDVILLGHSKGGIDILHALVNKPLLLEKVRGIVVIQSPFLGSPISKLILNDPVLHWLASKILIAFKGSPDMLVDMGETHRLTWMQENDLGIARLLRSVPFLSFSAWKKEVPWKWDSLFEWSRTYLEKQGIDNDGMVPWKSAIIPESNYVVVEGLDHAVTIGHHSRIVFDRVRFTKSLMSLLRRLKPLE